MLNHIHQWKKPIQFLQISRTLSSQIFTKPPSFAAKPAVDPAAGPSGTANVAELITGLRILGLDRIRGDHYYSNIISSLNQTQVDVVIERLSLEDPESGFGFFNLLRSEYGFRHSRISGFAVAHGLGGRRRFEELRLVMKQMVKEEGSDSATSLCELLLSRFRDWGSSGVVWDVLAFSYSRSEMVYDALTVLAKMKDLNLRVSTATYNCLLHNLRHTDIMWNVYDAIKESGTPENEYTSSILVDGLCEQASIQDAVSFLMEAQRKESGPSVVSVNTIMSRFFGRSFGVYTRHGEARATP
ncbi:hypothetical protein ACLB2K_036605 [Fragaria x ananassa]